MVTGKIQYNGKPLIWPLPNNCTWLDGYFKLKNEISFYCDSDFKAEVDLIIPVVKSSGINLYFNKETPIIKALKSSSPDINDEGYILEIAEDSITVQGKTKRGIFYGLQSLIQLIENSEEMGIPSVLIVDSPFKPVRGIHLYVPPRDSLEWFKRYIDFIAKYKYNTIYWELGAGMKFDSHPEINEAWVQFCMEMKSYPGGPVNMPRSIGHAKNSNHTENAGGYYLEKFEIAELIEYINKRNIEIIPEVQSLSHSYWILLAHKEYAELCTDPYPDTYCPSNPGIYELYFDCLKEIIDLFNPKTVHIGHDEYYTIGRCPKCREKTGHDILAGDVLKIHAWLAEKNIKTAMWGDKLMDFTYFDGRPAGGREQMRFNTVTRLSERMPATHRAVDMLPSDIIISDWYHTLGTYDTRSQDYFYSRGMNIVYGNFNDVRSRRGMYNLEDRLRRSNVLGGECSIWHEVSELGMAITNAPIAYLDVVNILWHEGYKFKNRPEYNNIIAQIYPLERDRMNNRARLSLNKKNFIYIDISKLYNVPLNWISDFSFLATVKKLDNTVDFEICKGVKNYIIDPACILTGHGLSNFVDGIIINERLEGIAFLHAYSKQLSFDHSCSYFDRSKEIVGSYIVKYNDGTNVKIPIEYSRMITGVDNEFGSYWADPVYQSSKVQKKIIKEQISNTTLQEVTDCRVLFSYEWRNPFPEKEIVSLNIENNEHLGGGIQLFGITGIY
jgi:hypothetical protein